VYWFLDEDGRVLYVGKAKNLKNRVTSYTRLKQLRRRTGVMVRTAKNLKWEVLESELEALLVEAELIRLHQPEYNILLKDDKTPLYINITDEPFPQVNTVRKKDVTTGKISGVVLGPFSSGYRVKEVLKLVRPIFRWCNNPANSQGKPCFYYHLDMCSGACVGDISQEEYRADLNALILFLRGKKKEVVTQKKAQMKAAAATQAYEQAARLRDEIELITAVTSHRYKLKPDLVLPQLKETKREEGLIQLRGIISEQFSLPRTIELGRIEGYDVSNIQGTSAAVSMVTAINGAMDSSEYKVFTIRGLQTPNDYYMLQEALTRRQNHPEWGRPDLIVIDGGKGQLRAVLKIWQWSTPVISIAKDPDRLIIPKWRQAQKLTATTSLPNKSKQKLEYLELKLPEGHPALQLVQKIRDESHRFSRRQHHSLQRRKMLNSLQNSG